MHEIEPHYKWRKYYKAELDKQSPFYKRKYDQFNYSHTVYNHVIHPQWDEFGTNTLYIKIIYTDYTEGCAFIEMIGEWNDCINNDIMYLKREVIDVMLSAGINKFILIGESVMNFHADADDYYEEWFQDVEDGYIVALNFHEHVLQEMKHARLDYYLNWGGELDDFHWRVFEPQDVFEKIDGILSRRLH